MNRRDFFLTANTATRSFGFYDGDHSGLCETTRVQAGEARDIVRVFDNPGKWMVHCHMLSHQAGGMKTWVEVL